MSKLGCPVDGCSSSLSRRDNLKRHLIEVHGLSPEQAEDKLPALATKPKKHEKSLADKILEYLKRGNKTTTLEQLSDHFNVGVKHIREALEQLAEESILLEVQDEKICLGKEIAPPPPQEIEMDIHDNLWVRFGVISDTHLCSKFQRQDVLNHAYEIFRREGVGVVLHAGNIIDGYCRFNRFEVLATGVDDQILYLIQNYPQVEGVRTLFITADDHEGWWVQREHINIGEIIEMKAQREGRTDLQFVGHTEADLKISVGERPTRIRLFHPGGGTAYALSYRPQKIIESLQGGEKPDILIIGHFHKLGQFILRNVHVLLAGCCQDQTRFMRKKSIAAHIGFFIVRANIAPDGSVNRLIPEQLNYYDARYYEGESWVVNGEVNDGHFKEWVYPWQ